MVCQSTEGGGFLQFSSSSLLPPRPLLPQEDTFVETPSETSVFLPVVVEVNLEEDPAHNHYYPDNMDADMEGGRLLVISEATPLQLEKVLEDSEEVPEDDNVKTDGVTVYQSCTYIESDDKLDGSGGTCGQCCCAKKRQSWCKNYMGILLTLASGLAFTVGGVIVKYMKEYHPFTLAIFRFQGILLPSLAWVLYMRYFKNPLVFQPIWPLSEREKAKRVCGMLLRCAFGTTALFFHFYALQRLDVADALVIGSCQPVFVTLAAYFFLGEACGIFPVFTAFLTILGVGVISRPPILTGEEAFDENALMGAGFSMASMLSATMVFVIIRYLKDVHVSIMTFVLGCWGTLQSVVCSIIIGEFTLPQTVEHWGLAVALAVITLLGQVGLTLALQWEQAGPVALVRTCDCLFAFVLQFILLNTVPDLFSLTGASIIIFCVVLTAFRKWITMLPKDHPAKKRFRFVMA